MIGAQNNMRVGSYPLSIGGYAFVLALAAVSNAGAFAGALRERRDDASPGRMESLSETRKSNFLDRSVES
jgi:hypothetical protein